MAQAWAAGIARAPEHFMATMLFERDKLDFAAIARAASLGRGGASLVYPMVLMPRGVRVGAQQPPQPPAQLPPQPPA